LRKCQVRVCHKTHSGEWPLDGLGPGEETAIDSVHDRLCGNLLATKETAIEALDGVLSALDTVELQINVALRVRIYRDVNNMAIFFFALLANVVLQFLDPGVTLLSGMIC
jgi:hypothetical protein